MSEFYGLGKAISGKKKYPGGIAGMLLRAVDEAKFRAVYTNYALQAGLDLNPYDPQHHYNYRAAYDAGLYPTKNAQGQLHWPSQFKDTGHPRRYMVLDGRVVDTATGQLMLGMDPHGFPTE